MTPLLFSALILTLSDPVHVTWLWHLEQPIYWPGPDASGRRYPRAWESIQAKRAGAQHPENDLDEIFGKDDRIAVYQARTRDAVGGLLDLPNAGAQISYSGGLIENIMSLGQAGQLGYHGGWADPIREARGWQTQGGHTRLDVVIFPFHHALIPLLHPRVVQMELDLYKEIYVETWGGGVSKGIFPSEMAFAQHNIPQLVEAGLEWVIIGNTHLSRACEDYPFQAGSGGDNIPPPNRADMLNPAQGDYNRISIDRGVSPANAVPFAYTPHRARYVDPVTGQESKIIVVPAAQSESWQDGYACFGVGPVNDLATRSGDRPMLLVLAHDGDNAFGGGYSYYHECTPNFAREASGQGHQITTIQQYLSQHAPPLDDVVHVEPGAWVNAEGDFGAPTFWNWNWPLVNAQGEVDIAEGWAEDERNWAVITAATSHVLHAEAIAGRPNLRGVYDPSGQDAIASAWHFLLGALNSGYMYYGAALDMELKPSVACNAAIEHAQRVHQDGAVGDQTPPVIWHPQRYPDNPGGLNFGTLYRFQQVVMGPAFWVWTFVDDVSEVDRVTLYVREDADGRNPLGDDANELYAQGPGVGAWVGYNMTRRVFPTGNPLNNPEIDTSILPVDIADEYFVEVDGYADVLLDYFVEAIDARGNVARSPIQHVWIGDQAGEGGGDDLEGVHWRPSQPWRGAPVRVRAPRDGFLHWGINGWRAPDEGDWPQGTEPFDGNSVDSALQGPDEDGFYYVDLGPFDEDIEVIDFVMRWSDGSWDNNGGRDWHIQLDDAPPEREDAGAGGGQAPPPRDAGDAPPPRDLGVGGGGGSAGSGGGSAGSGGGIGGGSGGADDDAGGVPWGGAGGGLTARLDGGLSGDEGDDDEGDEGGCQLSHRPRAPLALLLLCALPLGLLRRRRA